MEYSGKTTIVFPIKVRRGTMRRWGALLLFGLAGIAAAQPPLPVPPRPQSTAELLKDLQTGNELQRQIAASRLGHYQQDRILIVPALSKGSP